MKERFILQKSNKPNYWVCTDTVNGIVCVFEHKNFNENQTFTLLEDMPMPDASALAKIARELGDWIAINHREKAI